MQYLPETSTRVQRLNENIARLKMIHCYDYCRNLVKVKDIKVIAPFAITSDSNKEVTPPKEAVLTLKVMKNRESFAKTNIEYDFTQYGAV